MKKLKYVFCLLVVVLLVGCSKGYKEGEYTGSAVDSYGNQNNTATAKVTIDKDVLEEAMYDPGVEYMFKTGILYINEMEDKIALGLEPEGATKPENIIILTDDEKKEWMSSKKQSWELKTMLEKLSYEGKKDFCPLFNICICTGRKRRRI